VTAVPGSRSAGSGIPPSRPAAKAHMSIEYTPVQSAVGIGDRCEVVDGAELVDMGQHGAPERFAQRSHVPGAGHMKLPAQGAFFVVHRGDSREHDEM